MRTLRLLALIIILGIFQVTILDYFRFFGVKPDLLLVAVFISGLFLDFKSALGVSLFAGIFKDAFSLNIIGLNTVFFPIWVILIMRVTRKVSIEDNFSRSLFLFVIALSNNLLSGLTLVYFKGFVPLGIFLRITLVASVYTALILPLALRLFRRL